MVLEFDYVNMAKPVTIYVDINYHDVIHYNVIHYK